MNDTTNAAAINAAAKDLANRGRALPGYVDVKVWICDVIDALRGQNPGWTEAEIRSAMRTTGREVMYLSADLIGALDPVKLARSRTVVNQHRDHAVFVVVL